MYDASFHVKSIRVNAGKKRCDVAAQKQWPVWQLSRPAPPLCPRRLPPPPPFSLSFSARGCRDKSREPANQSRRESFRPVYRINLRPLLVTFAESLGISGEQRVSPRVGICFRSLSVSFLGTTYFPRGSSSEMKKTRGGISRRNLG